MTACDVAGRFYAFALWREIAADWLVQDPGARVPDAAGHGEARRPYHH